MKSKNWITHYIKRTDYPSGFSQKYLACSAFYLISLACDVFCFMKKSCPLPDFFQKRNHDKKRRRACRHLQHKSFATHPPKHAALHLGFKQNSVQERCFCGHNTSDSVWLWRWRANNFEKSQSLSKRCGCAGRQLNSDQAGLKENVKARGLTLRWHKLKESAWIPLYWNASFLMEFSNQKTIKKPWKFSPWRATVMFLKNLRMALPKKTGLID